ncbi:hypothetical protein EYF80_064852 [Liparis tanakae]|uniref:Uncharacterized protein n=1 Tax=Liparis tanakae TaxID=230148 RepID=A0A4Z2E8C8_9TELE|nr:hypothetical protein EYF80_064852 [Liparis tanakae]
MKDEDEDAVDAADASLRRAGGVYKRFAVACVDYSPPPELLCLWWPSLNPDRPLHHAAPDPAYTQTAHAVIAGYSEDDNNNNWREKNDHDVPDPADVVAGSTPDECLFIYVCMRLFIFVTRLLLSVISRS